MHPAIQHLRTALDALKDLELPPESGLERLSLARALKNDGDHEGAIMELSVAEKTFERSQADFYLQLCKEAFDTFA